MYTGEDICWCWWFYPWFDSHRVQTKFSSCGVWTYTFFKVGIDQFTFHTRAYISHFWGTRKQSGHNSVVYPRIKRTCIFTNNKMRTKPQLLLLCICVLILEFIFKVYIEFRLICIPYTKVLKFAFSHEFYISANFLASHVRECRQSEQCEKLLLKVLILNMPLYTSELHIYLE